MIPTHATALELRDRIRAALDTPSAPVTVVTTDMNEASAAVTSGACAVVIAPPRVRNTGPAVELVFEVPVVGAPVGDQDSAWQALDALVTVLDESGAIDPWDSLEAVTWGGAQTMTAPAYLLTLTITTRK